MIALPVKNLAQPVEQRNARVSVMSSHAQDANVQRDQHITERCESKAIVCRPKNNERDDPGENLQPPCQSIVRIYSRPNENDRDTRKQHKMEWINPSHFQKDLA